MSLNIGRIEAYFSHLVSQMGTRREVCCVAVAHMVPNTIHFASALNHLTSLAAILPKPKSVGRPEYKILKSRYKILKLSREWAQDASSVSRALVKLGLSGKDIVLVDIGGYFASSISEISDKFSGNILGILEGTENGAKKYEKYLPFKIPVLTVARSPLKLPEDYLVGSSVVFSIEAVLRAEAEIMQTRAASVVGYGRVGSSIADILRGRGINTVVYDDDPIKLAEAAARGFQANRSLDDAIRQSSLVVCATGNRALTLRGFGMLQSGTVVASVTSSDDEFDLDCLNNGYNRVQLGPDLTRYEENRPGGRHFFMVADGNAANFLHGAVIGPAIQLIEGEKLAAIRLLIDRKLPPATTALHEVGVETRREVAQVWNEHFL